MTPNWITTAIERSRSRRPVTWLTLIGVLLLPVVIGGILVAALYNPTERLDSLTAAVVNEDEPVTINGQMVPLGRQLTAGLVEGSDDVDSNLTWSISNADDAAAGLADGTYAAVITIPENFSAAATSTQPGETPEKATIQVTTPPDSLIVDDAITSQVASVAASSMGTQLSQVYLENVFLGFTTLGDQLGTAADGATQLADGATKAADGAVSLADGVRKLSDGASQLSSGLTTWAGGAQQASAGLGQWAAGAQTLGGSTRQIAGGIGQIGAGLAQVPQIPQSTVDQANQLAANSDAIKAQAAASVTQLKQLAQQCVDQGGPQDICDGISTAAAQAEQSLTPINGILDQSGAIAQGVAGLSQIPALGNTLVGMSGNLQQIAGGMDGLAAGATSAATGVSKLADGATQLSSGAGQLATGASSAADGADGLADGVAQLADGTTTLADGLHTASDSLPSYTDQQATDLASVVADPVEADGVGSSLFGASAIPLLATLALWFGGLGTFIALQAVSRRALTSRRPSALLALRSYAPAAGLGALQGLLVAGVVQAAASYSWGEWWVFAAVCVVAGIAFAAVNQALVAVFGGAGRWIAALVGVLTVATGIVSTVPGVLSSIAGLMPTSAAYQGMVAALTSASGLGAAFAGLVIWTLVALGATMLAVARRRTTSARALLKTTPVTA
ncbi:MAG: YhgE/Pip family protein [Microbacterium sp.]|uniref:YhgE/Pip family protein n=1 Tax=Microbacterium sp. TaxID=51671 RepID=UPI003F806C08